MPPATSLSGCSAAELNSDRFIPAHSAPIAAWPGAVGPLPAWVGMLSLQSKRRRSVATHRRLAHTHCCLLSAARCPLPAVHCPLSAVRCPLSAVRCPLSAVRCPLSAVRCPLPAARYPLPAARCPRSAARCPMSVTRCPLPAARCLLPAARYPLPAARCPLSAVRCPLSAVRCPLSAVRCPLSAVRRRRSMCSLPAVWTVRPDVTLLRERHAGSARRLPCIATNALPSFAAAVRHAVHIDKHAQTQCAQRARGVRILSANRRAAGHSSNSITARCGGAGRWRRRWIGTAR